VKKSSLSNLSHLLQKQSQDQESSVHKQDVATTTSETTSTTSGTTAGTIGTTTDSTQSDSQISATSTTESNTKKEPILVRRASGPIPVQHFQQKDPDCENDGSAFKKEKVQRRKSLKAIASAVIGGMGIGSNGNADGGKKI